MTDDLYQIADEIPEMEDLDGWEEGAELPSHLPGGDYEFVRKRMLALQFRWAEHAETDAQFQAEIDKLLAEIDRLGLNREMELRAIRRSVKTLAGQLLQFHRAKIAMAEREHVAAASAAVAEGRPAPKQVLPTTVKNPHGQLRSRAGGNVKVRVATGHEADVVAWLDKNRDGAGVRVKPAVAEQRLPDLSKMGGLVDRGPDGDLVGIVNSDGETCPHVTYEETERAHWITLSDGSSSKDWKDLLAGDATGGS